MCIVSGLLIAWLVILASYLIGKDYLEPDIATTMFPTLIEVNATLIGFWGVIFVFHLKTLRETRGDLLKVMLDLIDKVERYVHLELEKSGLDEDEKRMLVSLRKRFSVVEELIASIDIALRDFVSIGVLVTSPFLASILLCITSLGKVSDVGIEVRWVEFSLVPLLLGVFLIFLSIWSSIPVFKAEVQEQQKLTVGD